ncbi:MAG: tRNA lysidine(34) synthetase TilS [Lachnospiraceae bacterium]|nr:tRNA lysidine(34) synthetase TilS [Lachnospiraceae bacterium]
MKEKIFAYIEKYKMLPAGTPVLVGFSGGPDSAALLALLKEYGALHGNPVRAVHMHHGIRGESADRDLMFCEAFCREREIPFRAFKRDVPGLAGKEGLSIEEAGRKARYEVFRQCMEAEPGMRTALAHHQNDQAETMLFRLMRGTGLKGLGGMRPVSLPYIRPLLCVGKDEILRWLAQEQIPWAEDESNADLSYERNRIRHQLIVPMEEIRPGSAARMAAAAERLQEDEDFMEQETERTWKHYVRVREQGVDIQLTAFKELHLAIRKRLVLRCMEQLRGSARDLEAVHVEQICALASGKHGSRIQLPGDTCAVLGYREISLRRAKKEPEITTEIPVMRDDSVVYEEHEFLGETFLFSLEAAGKNEKIPTNCYTKWFDYDKIREGAVLRTRRPGDYLANGKGSHKKLKDYLIDCKLPREERDKCILLADGSHVIWAVGLRISEDYKVSGQTKRILKVRKKNAEG